MKDNIQKYAYLKGDINDKFIRIDKTIREKFNKLPEEKKEQQKAPTFILYEFEMREQQRKPFNEKLRDTIDFIKEHLKAFKKPYIATSFGSDSIVLMKLVMIAVDELRNEGYDIEYPDMFLNDTLNTFKEEKQYWADISKEWGIIDKVKLFKPPVDKKGNMYTVWSIAKKVGHLPSFRSVSGRGKAYQKIRKSKKIKKIGGSGGSTPECCNILKKKTMKTFLNSLPENDRYDLQFVGTRAEESRARANILLQRCRTHILKTFAKYQMRVCKPLSFWIEDDIEKFYNYYNIRKNPAYEAHDMERMGCASCPAHRYWVTRLAKDPTEEGFGMLKQNFKILRETIEKGTEKQTDRLQKSVDELKMFLDNEKSQKISEKQRKRIEELIKEFDKLNLESPITEYSGGNAQ